jgi:hypothetical protein
MKFVKEPLLHFLLIGASLFLLYGWKGAPAAGASGGRSAGSPAEQIVVTRDDLERMNDLFARTWQRPPTEDERENLVEDFVRSEIYYREAIAMGLDRNDDVLRRRLRLKMEFLYEDVSSLTEPTDGELEAFLAAHPEKYRVEPGVAFRQVTIRTDGAGTDAETRAERARERLNHGADPESVGDPTLLEPRVAQAPLSEIDEQFGEGFGRKLLEVEPGAWAGPVRSSFGLHLVWVEERQEERMPELRQVREAVERDWLIAKQKELKDAAYAKLRGRYSVVVERAETVAGPLTASGARAG